MENSSKISHLLRTLTFLLITFFTHPTFTQAQNAVGSVNGALTVNDMGAAVYSVTFDAPNGGRMTPKIGLAYSSQSSGYGLAGYGIDVTGISVITSGGRDMFHNGKVRGANYDKDSNFYLDGKRLVLQEGEDGEGGAVYSPEGDPYTKVTFFYGVDYCGAVKASMIASIEPVSAALCMVLDEAMRAPTTASAPSCLASSVIRSLAILRADSIISLYFLSSPPTRFLSPAPISRNALTVCTVLPLTRPRTSRSFPGMVSVVTISMIRSSLHSIM